MNLQELENKVHVEKVKQITIDLVQNAEIELTYEDVTSDEFGAYLYKIGIILEVFNPCFCVDIKILQDLEIVLENMRKDLPSLTKKEQQ